MLSGSSSTCSKVIESPGSASWKADSSAALRELWRWALEDAPAAWSVEVIEYDQPPRATPPPEEPEDDTLDDLLGYLAADAPEDASPDTSTDEALETLAELDTPEDPEDDTLLEFGQELAEDFPDLDLRLIPTQSA